MERDPNNNASPKRRTKWVIVGCGIFVAAVAACLLIGTEPRPPSFEIAYYGCDQVGPTVWLSNKTDRLICFTPVSIQVSNKTGWTPWARQVWGVNLRPHQTTNVTIYLSGFVIPTNRWRGYAVASEPLFGLASLRARVRQLWTNLHPRPPRSIGARPNPFDPRMIFLGSPTTNHTAEFVFQSNRNRFGD